MAVLVLVGVLIFAALTIALLLRTGKSQAIQAWLDRALPPVRRLNDCLSAGRFAAILSMMLRSGYPLEEALPLIEDAMQNRRARSKIATCRARMAEGATPPVSIEASGLFDPLHNKMVHIAFLAGQADGAMEKLSDLYQERMDTSISRLVAMIEPTLVILLSVIIGAILLSVMLPMISIISSML
jgi:type IV pilus assembly protein PilC